MFDLSISAVIAKAQVSRGDIEGNIFSHELYVTLATLLHLAALLG